MIEPEADDTLAEPIVNAVKSGSYPDAEVAAADLSPAVFTELGNALQQAKQEVEIQVRSLSRDVAPDVDGWIARANQVQHDIQESKATARSIVEAAESHDTLQRATDDAAQKVDLLEKELAFSTALEDALKYIQSVAGHLADAKEKVVGKQIAQAFGVLMETQRDLDRLENSYCTNASRALSSRASSIKEAIIQASRDHVKTCIRVLPDKSSIDLGAKEEQYGDASLDSCTDILRRTDSLQPVIQAFRRDLERTFFEPWSVQPPSEGIARLQTTDKRAWLNHDARSADVNDSLADAGRFIGFLHAALPKPLLDPIAHDLLPTFWETLERDRLNASVPVEIDQLGSFDETLTAVSRFSRTLSTTEWSGHDKVQEWIAAAPRVWLSRQKEHTLEAVRNSLLGNLRQLKEAEKVETQLANTAVQGVDEEAWDTEWKEEEVPSDATKSKTLEETGVEDDDASAWDLDEDKPVKANGGAKSSADDNDDDTAWGWGEGQEASPVKTKDPPKSPRATKKGNEITLRELYTVTGVPDALFAECSKVLIKAKQLSGEQFSSSAIAPGITGLLGIPTLATALYRALALTTYDKVDNGKVLLYNDSMRMADLLRSLVEGKADVSPQVDLAESLKRKLVQDVAAFERFGKVSYGAEMESQKTIIRDLMDGAQGFSNCTTPPYTSECDDAVQGTIHRISAIHSQWSGILSKSALKQATGSLLGTATSKFMVDIQELSDIGEVESKQLLGYVKSISTLSSLFEEQHAQSGEVRDMTPLYCSNWLKFQYFGEILDGSLADIKYLWTEGELSLEFEADEVTDLIEALFADSEHRRKAIAEIKSIRR
ncbi:hypothetical protein KVT40_008015 [Elsinoe batatas]|uniref:ZW10 C-terminal helical domain-containing protein n=1 Tax=Elsinoe batatas TaxID=2601811 RepID=A0A8K0PEY8_9PEZI|nr:hypothetical protein KVT40_008015 [Elsinoe batatas]